MDQENRFDDNKMGQVKMLCTNILTSLNIQKANKPILFINIHSNSCGHWPVSPHTAKHGRQYNFWNSFYFLYQQSLSLNIFQVVSKAYLGRSTKQTGQFLQHQHFETQVTLYSVIISFLS